MRNTPSGSVVPVRVALVACSVTVTVAPGSAPPWASTIVAVSVPFPACARRLAPASSAQPRTSMNSAQTLGPRCFIDRTPF